MIEGGEDSDSNSNREVMSGPLSIDSLIPATHCLIADTIIKIFQVRIIRVLDGSYLGCFAIHKLSLRSFVFALSASASSAAILASFISK